MSLFYERISRDRDIPMKGIFSRVFTTFRFTSFTYLNVTQFLGAMNDNIFKLLIVYCFIHHEGVHTSSSILAAAGALYVMPFLFFSQTAGTLADKYSKRTIIVLTKLMEMVVMLLGMIAFALVSKLLAFVSLFLLATHSALFGPCKYGIVPEIVPAESISKANGLLTSFTYTAIIIGTFLASFLTDITDRHFVYAALFSCACAFIGFLASFGIKKTAPSGSQKKVTAHIISEFIKNLRVIRKEPSLLSAVLGSSYFLFVGSFCQLNMIPFAIKVLHLSDIEGGYLFLLTALGIGAGSLLAGKFSGKTVELGLVPVGGIGMTICFFLLDYWSQNVEIVLPLVVLLGLFGGLYLVPLDSFIQVTSPKIYRGQVIATSNIFGFLGVLLSAGTLYVLSDVLHLEPDHGFSLMGMITLGVVIAITISMSGYVVRFFSLIVSRLLYPMHLEAQELIPVGKPSFFFAPQPFWPWASVLLACQRRRMKLFTLHADTQISFSARLTKKLIPILEVFSLSDLEPEGEQGDVIRHALQRGTSIGIFCSNHLLDSLKNHLITSWKKELDGNSVNFFMLMPQKNPSQTDCKKRKKILFAKLTFLE